MTVTRATSVYTFHTPEPTALVARLQGLDVQIQDYGSASISVRLRGGDEVALAVASTAEHTGRITTGLGIHQRQVA